MSSDHASGAEPEQRRSPDAPRLDAHGMPVGSSAADGADPPDGRTVDRGPSLLLPCLVTALGAAAVVLALGQVVRVPPDAGQARPMTALVLASALALGGFSLTRLVQLWGFATRRQRGRSPAREVPWQLVDAHAAQAVWAIGVGASIALMGVLGLWSLLDGRPSGLEPGWPLMLCGGAVALLSRLLWQRTSALWEESGEGI